MVDPVKWHNLPGWEIGPWHVRSDGEGGFTAYAGKSPYSNPLFVALAEVPCLAMDGLTVDMPDGVTVEDVDNYTRMIWDLTGQEMRISPRQAEEFVHILRSMDGLQGSRMDHFIRAAVTTSLRLLSEGAPSE